MRKEAQIFDQIVEYRRSCRSFDTEFKMEPGVVERSIRRAVLAPNSSNMQLWEFYRIKSPEKIAKMANLCLDQKGAYTASEMVVFVARPDLWRRRIKSHLENIKEEPENIEKKSLLRSSKTEYYTKIMPMFYNNSMRLIRDLFKWVKITNRRRKKPFVTNVYSRHIPVVVHKSLALAAQTFMLSISAECYDSLPMEGYDAKRIKSFLNLPPKSEINMVISVGKRLPEGIKGDRYRIPFEEVYFEV